MSTRAIIAIWDGGDGTDRPDNFRATYLHNGSFEANVPRLRQFDETMARELTSVGRISVLGSQDGKDSPLEFGSWIELAEHACDCGCGHLYVYDLTVGKWLIGSSSPLTLMSIDDWETYGSPW